MCQKIKNQRHDPLDFVSRETWMMVHSNIRQLARIKVVVDWLASVVQTQQNKTSSQWITV
jgi:hypothetical protein